MQRRTFLTLAGGLALGAAGGGALLPRATLAASERLDRWAPVPTDVVQWRYVAGRITNSPSDFGFVVSLTNFTFPTVRQELLVERKDFTGAQDFKSATYVGSSGYDSNTGTYGFRDSGNVATAIWQWDEAAGVYRLNLVSPELTMNMVFRPQGDVIPEAGDGIIDVGQVLGIAVNSDYHTDWATIELGGVTKGVARIDMQGLYPASSGAPAATVPDYDHHWFAIAGTVDGAPVWVSCWRIEQPTKTLWDVTIARGGGTSYSSVISVTEANNVVAPFTVQPLALQSLPDGLGPDFANARAGQRWHLTAGLNAPGDIVNLYLAVPPGQYAESARLAVGGVSWVEEALGTTASGTVAGLPISNVKLVVAETTNEVLPVFAPIVQKRT